MAEWADLPGRREDAADIQGNPAAPIRTIHNPLISQHGLPEPVYRVSNYDQRLIDNGRGHHGQTNPLLLRFYASNDDHNWHSAFKSSPGALPATLPGAVPLPVREQGCSRTRHNHLDLLGPSPWDQHQTALSAQVHAREVASLKKTVWYLGLLTIILMLGIAGLVWLQFSASTQAHVLHSLNQQKPITSVGEQQAQIHSATSPGHSGPYARGSSGVVTCQRCVQEDGFHQLASGMSSVKRLPLSGLIRDEHLRQLSHVVINGVGGTKLSIRVLSTARVPKWDSVWGTRVSIKTPLGALILNDQQLLVKKDISNHLAHLLNLNNSAAGKGMQLLQLGSQDQRPSSDEPGEPLLQGIFTYTSSYPYAAQGALLIDPTVWNGEGLTSKPDATKHSMILKTLIHNSKLGDGSSQAVLLAAWSDWKRRYKKPSAGAHQDASRFKAWQQNIARLVASNLNPTFTFWGRVNGWFDLDIEDFKASLPDIHTQINELYEQLHASDEHDSYLITEQKQERLERQLLVDPVIQTKGSGNSSDPPGVVDWVAAGKVTTVKDQKRCGNCWAYAAVSALESAYLISHPQVDPQQLDLSEAHVTFCVLNATGFGTSRGCLGGTPAVAFKWIVGQGVTTEDVYPFPLAAQNLGSNQECQMGELPQPMPLLKLAKPAAVFSRMSERALMQAVARAPVVVYFQFVDDFWHYSSGVYNGACPSDNITVNHVMTVVGYNVSDRTWLVKNSWSSDWGVQGGFVRLPMTGDNIGKCGLQLFVLTVNPVFSIDTLNLTNLSSTAASARTGGTPNGVVSPQGSPQ